MELSETKQTKECSNFVILKFTDFDIGQMNFIILSLIVNIDMTCTIVFSLIFFLALLGFEPRVLPS
jgi:hypothetical protein